MRNQLAKTLHEAHERVRQLEVQCVAEAYADGYDAGWKAAMAQMERISNAEKTEAVCDTAARGIGRP